jgi:hypothetical protein
LAHLFEAETGRELLGAVGATVNDGLGSVLRREVGGEPEERNAGLGDVR